MPLDDLLSIEPISSVNVPLPAQFEIGSFIDLPTIALRDADRFVDPLPAMDVSGPGDLLPFGNAIGESGDCTTDAGVGVRDQLLAWLNPRSTNDPADIDNVYGFDRDGRVNEADEVLARLHTTSPVTALKLT